MEHVDLCSIAGSAAIHPLGSTPVVWVVGVIMAGYLPPNIDIGTNVLHVVSREKCMQHS